MICNSCVREVKKCELCEADLESTDYYFNYRDKELHFCSDDCRKEFIKFVEYILVAKKILSPEE